MTIQATALVCDDVRFEVNGKYIVIGLYSGDILINQEPFTASQMFFIFLVEGEISTDQFKWLEFEVTFPGNEPTRVRHPGDPKWSDFTRNTVNQDRTRWWVKYPLRISPVVLRPGRVITKVIHDKGEIACTSAWVVLKSPPVTVEANN